MSFLSSLGSLFNTAGEISKSAGGSNLLNSLFGAGGSFLGSLFSGSSAKKDADRAFKQSLEGQKYLMSFQNSLSQQLMGFQNEQQKDLTQWNNQQSLDLTQQLPGAQVTGMMNAGLNPALAGQGMSQGVSTPVSSGNGVSPSTNMTSSPLDAIIKFKQLENETKVANSQANLNNSQASNNSAMYKGFDVESDMKQTLLDAGIDNTRADTLVKWATENNIDFNTHRGQKMLAKELYKLDMEIDEINETIENIKANTANVNEHTLHYWEIESAKMFNEIMSGLDHYSQISLHKAEEDYKNALTLTENKMRRYNLAIARNTAYEVAMNARKLAKEGNKLTIDNLKTMWKNKMLKEHNIDVENNSTDKWNERYLNIAGSILSAIARAGR